MAGLRLSGTTGAIICIFAISCRLQPEFRDDLKRDALLRKAPSLADAIDAPLIFVGVVQRVRQIGRPKPAMDVPEVLLEPIEVTVRPELALRGTLEDPIVVFGFRFSRENSRSLGLIPFDPNPDKRRLFFLRGESGSLRFWHDVLDYTIRVYSGFHPTFDAASFPKIGSAIAWILLTPEQGYNSEGFTLRLSEYVHHADTFGADREALILLNQLRASPDTTIRQEAEFLWQSLKVDSDTSSR